MTARRSGDESFTKIVLGGLLVAIALQVIPGIIPSESEVPVRLRMDSGVIVDSSRDPLPLPALPLDFLGPVAGQLPWLLMTFPDSLLQH